MCKSIFNQSDQHRSNGIRHVKPIELSGRHGFRFCDEIQNASINFRQVSSNSVRNQDVVYQYYVWMKRTLTLCGATHRRLRLRRSSWWSCGSSATCYTHHIHGRVHARSLARAKRIIIIIEENNNNFVCTFQMVSTWCACTIRHICHCQFHTLYRTFTLYMRFWPHGCWATTVAWCIKLKQQTTVFDLLASKPKTHKYTHSKTEQTWKGQTKLTLVSVIGYSLGRNKILRKKSLFCHQWLFPLFCSSLRYLLPHSTVY